MWHDREQRFSELKGSIPQIEERLGEVKPLLAEAQQHLDGLSKPMESKEALAAIAEAQPVLRKLYQSFINLNACTGVWMKKTHSIEVMLEFAEKRLSESHR